MVSQPDIANEATRNRMDEQRRRWRLLYGYADNDVRERIKKAIGAVKSDAWGALDFTSNPFLAVWSQAAGTYRSEPRVFAPEGLEDVAEAIAESGHWSMMQRVQRDALALRENFVRLDYDPNDGGLAVVPVPPYLIEPVVHPRFPHKMVAVTEWRPDPREQDKWVRIVTDPRSRTHKALDQDGNDISLEVLDGQFNGKNYPFVDAQGEPILPYVCYRAALTGSFWDSFTGRELVETSFQLAVLYSFYVHAVKDASWVQRLVLGAELVGTITDEKTGRAEVTLDPSAVAFLRKIEGHDGPVIVDQWEAPSDPEVILRSIQAYERRAVDAALGTANVSRSNSDIRSGFSLAVSRDEQRELMRSYEPVFRRSDLELLQKVTALMGRTMPAKGKWRIAYKSIPKSPQEIAAQVERLVKEVEAGLKSRVEAYMEMHPQMSESEAAKRLDEIATINRRTAA